MCTTKLFNLYVDMQTFFYMLCVFFAFFAPIMNTQSSSFHLSRREKNPTIKADKFLSFIRATESRFRKALSVMTLKACYRRFEANNTRYL